MNNQVLKGFYPDPSICRVGEDYYLICSSFEYFPGVPIFHSKDLENWEQIGNILDRPSQLPLEDLKYSNGIFAPTLRYNSGKFYMITTLVNRGDNRNFIVSATNPAGPWSEPIYLDLPVSGIDPSLLFDNDGKCYVTISGNYQAEINPDTGELLSEMKMVWEGTGGCYMEAPHLYHIGDYYYLMVAEGGTSLCHMATIGRSKSPWGPFEAAPQVVVTGIGATDDCVQCCGHADLVDDGKGNWYGVFLGIRKVGNFFPQVCHLGRESFITEASWQDGFPIFNNGEKLLYSKKSEGKLNYDFSSRHFSWVELRNSTANSYNFSENGVAIVGNGKNLSDISANPSGLFHRAIETNFEFSVNFSELNGEAGITLFANEFYHFDFYKLDNQWILKRQAGDLICYDKFECAAMSAGVTFLDAEAIFFTIENGVKTEHIKVLNRSLAIEVAGGFTGLMLGIFANNSAKLLAKNAIIEII